MQLREKQTTYSGSSKNLAPLTCGHYFKTHLIKLEDDWESAWSSTILNITAQLDQGHVSKLTGNGFGHEAGGFGTIGRRLGLGPPVVLFYPFWGEGSPTKIDCRTKRYPYSSRSTG